ncbi:hypothetical protein IKZ40_08430 [bacterium]|nr:hypothetical protein [bacterium]
MKKFLFILILLLLAAGAYFYFTAPEEVEQIIAKVPLRKDKEWVCEGVDLPWFHSAKGEWKVDIREAEIAIIGSRDKESLKALGAYFDLKSKEYHDMEKEVTEWIRNHTVHQFMAYIPEPPEGTNQFSTYIYYRKTQDLGPLLLRSGYAVIMGELKKNPPFYRSCQRMAVEKKLGMWKYAKMREESIEVFCNIDVTPILDKGNGKSGPGIPLFHRRNLYMTPRYDYRDLFDVAETRYFVCEARGTIILKGAPVDHDMTLSICPRGRLASFGTLKESFPPHDYNWHQEEVLMRGGTTNEFRIIYAPMDFTIVSRQGLDRQYHGNIIEQVDFTLEKDHDTVYKKHFYLPREKFMDFFSLESPDLF